MGLAKQSGGIVRLSRSDSRRIQANQSRGDSINARKERDGGLRS